MAKVGIVYFGKYLVMGIGGYIITQVLINIYAVSYTHLGKSDVKIRGSTPYCVGNCQTSVSM